MQMNSLDLHEMLNPIFWENKNYFKMPSVEFLLCM